MRQALASVMSFFLLATAIGATEVVDTPPFVTKAAFKKNVVVSCEDDDSDSDSDRGSIARALRKHRKVTNLNLFLRGTCVESLEINRDNLTLEGLGPDAAISGLVNVNGGSNVVFRGFTIRDGDDQPRSGGLGGINALNGASVTIENMMVRDIGNARGIRTEGASALIVDTTVINAAGGAFVFRTSSVTLGGTIEGSDSLFGMSIVTSMGFARRANLTFNRNGIFGLVIQLDSSLEHVEGTLTANDNAVGGFVLAGHGSYAHGTQIELRNNNQYGFFVDELSNLTPLIGAPGGGPAYTVTDHSGIGVFIDRTAVVQLTEPTLITGNGTGIFAEASQLLGDGMTVENNGVDISLGFGTKATFNGTNTFGTPIACDDTVLIRGATCVASLNGMPAAKQDFPIADEEREMLLSVMPASLLR